MNARREWFWIAMMAVTGLVWVITDSLAALVLSCTALIMSEVVK